MDTDVLEKMGLTRTQAIVYLALLKLGSSPGQQVIKESGLHRSPVYDALMKLEEKGLVNSVIKDAKRYFQSVSPKRLYAQIEETRQELSSIMPALERLEGMKKEEISASIYKGKEGLKTIHLDMLREGKDIYVLGGKGLIFSELKFFMPHFEKERIRKGLKWKILWDKTIIKDTVSKKGLVEGKVLPRGCASNSVVNIYGNKVAIVIWDEEYPSAFLIDDEEVADSFRKWFTLIYELV